MSRLDGLLHRFRILTHGADYDRELAVTVAATGILTMVAGLVVGLYPVGGAATADRHGPQSWTAQRDAGAAAWW